DVRKPVDIEETPTETLSPPFPVTTTAPTKPHLSTQKIHAEYIVSKGKRGNKRPKDHEDALFARLTGFKHHITKAHTSHNSNSTVVSGEIVPKGNGLRRPLPDSHADANDNLDSQWLSHRLTFNHSDGQPDHRKIPDHEDDYEAIDSRVDRYKGRESIRD
ncbi:hypothetical protein IWQ62_003419, partial [Dispira parvispora]